MRFNKIINTVTHLLFTPDETVLDKNNKAHKALIGNMNNALYEIWEYSKSGNVAACDFMHSKLHDRLVQLELDFQNDDIPALHRRATYGAYKAVMAEVTPLLRRLRKGGAA